MNKMANLVVLKKTVRKVKDNETTKFEEGSIFSIMFQSMSSDSIHLINEEGELVTSTSKVIML